MFLNEDGLRLHLEPELPAGSRGRLPLVIVLHGFTGHMEEPHILAACAAMREAGYATLRAELYGHGQSGGAFRDHTLYKWLTNALTVIDYARGLEYVSELYLCGHSQGGLTAMLAAAMKADQIAGLIPLSPAWMIPEGARRGQLLGSVFDPDRIPDRIPMGPGLELDGNYIRVAQTVFVEPAMDRYKGPVLIVHGTADATVPFAFAEQAAARYAHCTLVPVEGDTHCFDRHPEQMAAAVKAWLLKHHEGRAE